MITLYVPYTRELSITDNEIKVALCSCTAGDIPDLQFEEDAFDRDVCMSFKKKKQAWKVVEYIMKISYRREDIGRFGVEKVKIEENDVAAIETVGAWISMKDSPAIKCYSIFMDNIKRVCPQ